MGDVLDERYELLSPLGSGGVGFVCEAFDRKLRRTVAIKILRPEWVGHETMRPRFERESEALAALAHPNLVMIIDYGLHEGAPYMVMELLTHSGHCPLPSG